MEECGLNVVATVCDQGSANVAAIRSLLDDTTQSFVRKKEENRHFGFLVNNKEIVPLLNLLKGIRNNMLTKDLHFTLNNIKRVAKWEHIEKLYIADRMAPFQMCPMLNDSHVIRGRLNKMKVKCCTQVFSKAVATAIVKGLTLGEFLNFYLHLHSVCIIGIVY
ncbi:hypothetical protein GWI33_022791 [Rhynchophorus ferrugineus]|uniref:Transposable element P transposase-like GTP-binding insertion domain-containing protein n=1 Tax=Rhynchophorus ferrugineus TaxID=354439 RepID=A0A834IPA7_RHYFE|nr:hypothetical protein GWI33_022791 [Rhynchophorus ferrugineus]